MKKMIELNTKLYGKVDLDKYITKNKEYFVTDFNKESIIYLADNGHKMSVNYNNISLYFDYDIIEIPKKDSIVEEVVTPNYYDNYKGTLYKIAQERGWNAYLFDIVKRLERAEKKGVFDEDLDKSIVVIQLWKKERNSK